jgi:transposase
MSFLKEGRKDNLAIDIGSAYSLLNAEYQDALKKIAALESEIARLTEQLVLMQHQRFGKKTEVSLGEAVVDETQTVAGYTRKKGHKSAGRLVDTSLLPRQKIIHDLSEAEKLCTGCHHPLSCMGQDISEQLEVLPLQLYVAEHIRYKYACTHCQTVQMAPKPQAPIPKALAGGSLITEVVLNKYQYHLPLYRQSKILASYQVNIPDNTLGQWVSQSGSGLMLVYEALWEACGKVNYLQVDETPVKVLKPEKKGYLWAYYAPHVAKGLVFFELSLTRSGRVAEERLKDFKGLLQTDGYAGYQKLRDCSDITGLGCLTHSRRKFDEVLKISKNKNGIAAEVIERLKPVYALEARMKALKVSFHTRKRLRQKQAWPVLKALKSWLLKNRHRVPPNSKLSVAVNYMLNQWPYLIAYCRHGMAEIDTNGVENRIRPEALGRRNWLFVGHEASGLIHALWYSLIYSALLNGLNPRVYVHYLLSKIHDLRCKKIDPSTLLPHVINRNDLQGFANEQIAIGKRFFNNSS